MFKSNQNLLQILQEMELEIEAQIDRKDERQRNVLHLSVIAQNFSHSFETLNRIAQISSVKGKQATGEYYQQIVLNQKDDLGNTALHYLVENFSAENSKMALLMPMFFTLGVGMKIPNHAGVTVEEMIATDSQKLQLQEFCDEYLKGKEHSFEVVTQTIFKICERKITAQDLEELLALERLEEYYSNFSREIAQFIFRTARLEEKSSKSVRILSKLDEAVSQTIRIWDDLPESDTTRARINKTLFLLRSNYLKLRDESSQYLAISREVQFNVEKLSEIYQEHLRSKLLGLKSAELASEEASIYQKQMRHFIAQGESFDCASSAMNLTPLHLAILFKDFELLNELVARKANFEVEDLQKNTPLHFASSSAPLPMMFLALKAASPEIINRANIAGKTPLHYATERDGKYTFMVALLLVNAGADVSITDANGKTALQVAAENNPATFEFLNSFLAAEENPIPYAENILVATSVFAEIKIFFQNQGAETQATLLSKELFEYSCELIKNFVKKVANKKAAAASRESAEGVEIATQELNQIMLSSLNLIHKSTQLLQENDSVKIRREIREMVKKEMEVVNQCVLLGADVNCQTEEGISAFFVANYFDFENSKEFLLQRGASQTLGLSQKQAKKLQKDFSESYKVWIFRAAKVAETVDALVEAPEISLEEVWSDLLVSLQKSFSAEKIARMQQLLKNPELDVNAATADQHSALHLAAKLGNVGLLQTLRARNANINAKAKDKSGEDISVLDCAILSKNNEAIKTVLNFENLDFAIISDVLKDEIKNLNLVKLILTEPAVIGNFAQLEKKQRNFFLAKLRQANKFSSGKIKVESWLKDFEEAVEAQSPDVAIVAVEEPKAEKLSKKEKERQRKAASKARAEQEEVKKYISEQIYDLAQVAADYSEARVREIEFRENQLMSAQDVDAPRMLSKAELEAQQVADFLAGARQINSVNNFPDFLRDSISGISQESRGVFLKGSAAYQKAGLPRLPTDLDFEIYLDGVKDWSDEIIREFVARKTGIAESEVKIYRSDSPYRAFNVNAKDDLRKLDFTFYDTALLPHEGSTQTTNREAKIFFAKSGDAQYCSFCRGGMQFGGRELTTQPLEINFKNRFVLSRLAFLEVIEVVNKAEILGALVREKIDAVKMLNKELKIEKLSSDPVQAAAMAQESLNRFAHLHNLDQNLRQRFLENLQEIVSATVDESKEKRFLQQVIAETARPSNAPNAGSVSHFKKSQEASGVSV